MRPTWDHQNPRDVGAGYILEMLESIRNVCEEIKNTQTLQCDVAYAIKAIPKELRGLRRDLKNKRRVR